MTANLPLREQQNSSVHAFQALLDLLPSDKNIIPIDHFFSNGLYARKMTVPEGMALVGKTHKFDHLAILLKGTVTVHSRKGTAVYKAPYVVNVVAGDKRAFIANEDVEWITVHATAETDISKMEEYLTGD
jgi:hypothetical protein